MTDRFRSALLTALTSASLKLSTAASGHHRAILVATATTTHFA